MRLPEVSVLALIGPAAHRLTEKAGAAGDRPVVVGGKTLILDVELSQPHMFGRVVGISAEGQPVPVELCDLPALQAVGRGLALNRRLQTSLDLFPQAGPLPVLLLGQATARCFSASNFS